MSRQHGYGAQLLLKKESAWGTSPSGNYVATRFNSCNLGGERGLIDDPLAGNGRDPLQQFQDVINVGGDINVPMDMRYIGHFLTGLFGNPTSAEDNGDYTHTFKSGGTSLPSYSLEVGHPAVPAFYMNAGCMVNSMTVNHERAGPASATFNFIGKSETKNTSSQGGTPTTLTLARASQFHGTVKSNDTVIANLNSATWTYSNNLVPAELLTTDGTIGGLDPGKASCNGNLNARFADATMLANALAGTPMDLEFAYTLAADLKLIVSIHEVYLVKSKPEISGPGGISIGLDFRGVYNTSNTAMVTAELTNDLAGTTYTA